MNFDPSLLKCDPATLNIITVLQQENQKQSSQIQDLVRQNKLKEEHVKQQEDRLLQQENKIQQQADLIKQMDERIKFFKAWIFGRKSEKQKAKDDWQYRLFNEIEDTAKNAGNQDDTVVVEKHVRKKGGRKPIPDNLPRIEIVHDIPEKTLPDGRLLKKIREETHETIFTSPKVVFVVKHIRPVYASLDGDQILTAPPEAQIIPKSMASPALLADILISKFCDSIPFYRQEKIFNRFDIDIPRQTMCQWAMKVHDAVKVLDDMLEEDVKKGPVISMDETPCQVLNEQNKANTTKSYMWVSRGGPPGKQILLYRYHPTKNSGFIKEFLGEFRGILQSDGYVAYDTAARELRLTQAGCWAHARRGFTDVLKIDSKSENAQKALEYIHKLYEIEKRSKDLPAEKIKEIRQTESIPILAEFKAWLDEKAIQISPTGSMGEAISYCLGQWKKLMAYVENGHIPIDNNLVENAIRPFVIGKKNWLFSGSPDGAEASAFFYSLIETAKANGFDPYWCLFYILEKFPLCKGEEDYRRLLPYNITQKDLDDYFDKHPILSKFSFSPVAKPSA
jgi:transposase